MTNPQDQLQTPSDRDRLAPDDALPGGPAPGDAVRDRPTTRDDAPTAETVADPKPDGPAALDAAPAGETAAARAPAGRRQRRFSIPDPQDHRLTERLEAFLEGPAPKGSMPAAPEVPPAPVGPQRPATSRPPIAIDSRADWNEALRYEAARHERYGSPAAVAVIDMVVFDTSGRDATRSSIDAAAAVVGRILRSTMRLPDRLARVGPTRFHALLPETNRADARRFAERARRAAEAALGGGAVQVTLRIVIAAPTREESLPVALAAAETHLAG
jgi:GGDEF domain-containing protein